MTTTLSVLEQMQLAIDAQQERVNKLLKVEERMSGGVSRPCGREIERLSHMQNSLFYAVLAYEQQGNRPQQSL